ncbi:MULTISPECIES: DUF6264 family protein [unclassified Cryobacterium]|uniref:DUF6264 family protein n=1 Tax=unclassified Cryobacterium TaxID=2649013 RepID=UPI00106B300E|nr:MULTISPECIES: DUF6264 family protein [unclassified Cryobacterium]TFD04581.1 hypothetical protein E3T29_14505 [Cryobacterium sp. TMT1-66-1]TFD08470.1 hypothetical protein E3T35_17550 [Cryobacterium sp. TMT1-2-2]
MTDNPDSVPPPAKDPRPRPQYGELAPEGWTWQPPQDTNRVDPAPSPTAGAGAGTPSPNNQQAPAAVAGPRTVPGWDRPWTIGLLAFGLLANVYGVFSLGGFPVAMQMFYTQEGLGTYDPAASIGAITTSGAIVLIFVWLAAAAISVRLLLRHRRAFYVPIVGGAVSLVVLFAFTVAALSIDTTLIEFLSRQ